jgi:hypothetical protein
MTTLDEPPVHTGHICAHCHQPIPGQWVLEVNGHTFHAALHYRGGDQRRCRDVARTLTTK